MTLSSTNLTHFKVTLSHFLNFISSNAGANTLKSIFLNGIQNKYDTENLWKICMSQTFIQTGITFILEDEGIIQNIKTKLISDSKKKNNDDDDDKDNNNNDEYHLSLTRKFETILNIIRHLSCNHQKEHSLSLTRWYIPKTTTTTTTIFPNDDASKMIVTTAAAATTATAAASLMKTNNVKFPEKLNPVNADIIATMLYQNAKNKTKKTQMQYTTVWFSLADIYVKNNEENNLKEFGGNVVDDYLSLPYSYDCTETKFEGNSINVYEYNNKDIAGIHNFFLSNASHKVHCLNRNHEDKNPSMQLYLKKNLWLSFINKYSPTEEEIKRLQMEHDQALDSNITKFRSSKIILFILSAHCFACDYHENFLTKIKLRQVLSVKN
uniref:Wsv137-like protein n=1 Tax=Metapenaeus joyneri majanivirus TaxID=2984280 RepID=A0A9C7CFJ3_9VIRU|nr:MAG: wsv137-like protein [Metapenaeus joyneri majanivirus]